MPVKVMDEHFLDPDDLMGNFNKSFTLQGLNAIRQQIDRDVTIPKNYTGIWHDACTDSSGRFNTTESSVIGNSSNSGITFTTDRWHPTDYGDNFFIIEADDDVTVSWSSNSCLLERLASGQWILYYTGAGNAGEAKAQMYKSLFYGTNGTDSLILDFTNVTALKTTYADDVGKRGIYVQINQLYHSNTSGASSCYVEVTFDDTTNNISCDAWSYVTANNADGTRTITSAFMFPTGTTVNSVARATTGASTSNDMGTDTSGDENDNPSAMRVKLDKSGPSTSTSHYGNYGIITVSYGGISALGTPTVTAGGGSASILGATTNTDFYSDHSIPLMTAFSGSTPDAILDVSIPQKGVTTNGISTGFLTTLIGDWEDGADINFKLISYNATQGTADAVDDTETTGLSSTGTGSATDPYGVRISLNNGCFLKSVDKHASCTATKAYLLRLGTTSVGYTKYQYYKVAEATFSGNTATFSSLIALQTNDIIVAGSDGASYTYVTQNTYSYPSAGTNLNFTMGMNNSATTIYNIANVVVQTSSTPSLVSGQDSGWKSMDEWSSFTEFNTNPTTLRIKMIPKSTSPTPEVPSVMGYCLFSDEVLS